MKWLANVKDAEGLAAELQRLLASGIKPTSLRLLLVVCEHDRELVSVVKVDGHRMLAYIAVIERVNVRTEYDGVNAPATTETVHGLKWGSQWRLDYLDGAAPDAYIVAGNACCSRPIRADWMEEQIAGGVRRANAISHE